MKLTALTLSAALGCTVAKAETWLPAVMEAARVAELNTTRRLASFLSQIGHETAGLKYLREIWGPTPTQRGYEGRKDLGNTAVGDGHRYLGRGAIQCTGRSNYAEMTRLLAPFIPGIDLIRTPELLEQSRPAMLSAALYWKARKLNRYADVDNVKVGRAVNRGNGESSRAANGEADRMARYLNALKVLA